MCDFLLGKCIENLSNIENVSVVILSHITDCQAISSEGAKSRISVFTLFGREMLPLKGSARNEAPFLSRAC